jgi:hypothetical protein
MLNTDAAGLTLNELVLKTGCSGSLGEVLPKDEVGFGGVDEKLGIPPVLGRAVTMVAAIVAPTGVTGELVEGPTENGRDLTAGEAAGREGAASDGPGFDGVTKDVN